MNEKRKKIIETVYCKIDKENKGVVSREQIGQNLNIENNVDFIKNRKTKEQIIHEFITNFH